MREKKKGYPKVVSIGYQKQSKEKELVKGKIPTIVNNLKDLGKITENQLVILGKIGKKKKIEIVKKAKEMKIEIHNLNVKRFLKKLKKPEENKSKPIKTESKDKPKEAKK
jgi:ribosomal protein L32E